MRFPPVAQLLLLPRDVMARGLAFLQISVKRKSIEWQISEFHAHYGSDALELASMWYDLTTTNIPEAKLTVKEKSDKGLQMFLLAHHWLWTYPRNAKIVASRFKLYKGYCQGKPLWTWIGRIAALKAKKIVWGPHLDSRNTRIFVVSVDGTDFKMSEKTSQFTSE
jgi:hypothetical protein